MITGKFHKQPNYFTKKEDISEKVLFYVENVSSEMSRNGFKVNQDLITPKSRIEE